METSSCLLTFTSFMIVFLEMGSLKSFGVLFNPIMDSLQCSAAELGTAIGLSNSIGFIVGKSLILNPHGQESVLSQDCDL